MNWPPIHPEAREEFDQIIEHLHTNAGKALARRFVYHAMEAVQRARDLPLSGSPVAAETRRIQLNPFSHDMVYLPDIDGDIYIVAFPHHRRMPRYWLTRV